MRSMKRSEENEIDYIRRKKRRGEELTDEEFETLTKYWQSGEGKNMVEGQYAIDSPMFRSFIPESHYPSAKPVDPTDILCSFCGCHVDRINLTTGRIISIAYFDKIVQTFPNLQIEEMKRARIKRVNACPDHAILIKPKTNKSGEVEVNLTDYAPSE